jgi:hypothetical protein
LIRLLALAAGLLVLGFLSCCVLPDVVFRWEHGRPPLAKEKFDASLKTVKPGMTFDQVRATLGEPYEKYQSPGDDGGEVWVYWTDPFQLDAIRVRFSKDGVVLNQWI